MLIQGNYLPDKTILSMLAKNKKSAWNHLYDKYAPSMYGIITNMTEDETIAQEILIATFLALRETKVTLQAQANLNLSLIRHTYQSTLKHLETHGLMPISTQPFDENYPLLHLLCFEPSVSKETNAESNISAQEVRKNLRAEFNHLRNHSK